MLTVVAGYRSSHHLSHQVALIEGLKTIGIDAKPSYTDRNIKTDLVACWGWRIGKSLQEKGHKVLVMERGYIGDRFNYTSMGWDGLNGYAAFPDYPDDGGQRFNEMSEIKPWKHGGDYVLIMGQVPGDQSLQGRDLMPWYSEVSKVAREFYGKPVLFRQHPDLTRKGIVQRPHGTINSDGDLSETLSRASLVITYNSNSAVDAVLSGIPALSFDQGSMARAVTGHEIGAILRPDREEWANALAWKQWSLDEISSGKPLKRLLDMVG